MFAPSLGDDGQCLIYENVQTHRNQTNPRGRARAHVVALTARLYAVSGKRAEALKTLAQLKSIARERYVADYNFALVYAALGEKDNAFEALEKSYRDHTVDMLTLHYDPLIDNLRSDSRFAGLLRRVGLQWAE